MDKRFCCFCTWDDMEPRCLLRCPDRYVCKQETEIAKFLDALREEAERIKDEEKICSSV